MKIGFSIAGVAAQDYVAVARTADNLGYDLLMVSDHLVVPRVIPSNYPYTEDGTPPFDRSTPWLDPLVSLGFVASATKRILLGTNILILPLRDPTLVAKQVATLDQLSNGRLLLGSAPDGCRLSLTQWGLPTRQREAHGRNDRGDETPVD